MRLDGLDTHVQLHGDLGVGHTASDEGEHLGPALGELVVAPRWTAPAGTREFLDQPPRDAEREELLAASDGSHASDELLARCVLEQEPARSGDKGVVDQLGPVERREYHHPRLRLGRRDPSSCCDAVEFGHADVHEYDVRPQRAGKVYRLVPIGSLAHDLQVVLGREDHAKASADELLVVGKEDRRHRWSWGMRAATRNPLGSR